MVEIIDGIISIIVSGLMLIAAYSKHPEPVAIVRIVKGIVSAGWPVYFIFWGVFVFGAFDVVRGLYIVFVQST